MKFKKVIQEAKEKEKESYTATLHAGDKILIGKYRNKEAEIKGFEKDKHNQPTMNTTKGTRKVHAFRIKDDMPEESAQDKYHEFLKKKLKEFGKSSVRKLSPSEKRELSDGWKKEKEES